ncbi:MAG: CoA transferase [Antricoccus sp.]
MTGPLDDLYVLDTTSGVAGAVATMLLGDFGATVLRVESGLQDQPRDNPGFAMWDRNKSVLANDPGTAQNEIDRLLPGTDIYVYDHPDAAIDIADANPGLVQLYLPAYLDECPWFGGAESNELLSAALGISMRQSSFEDRPVDPVYPHILYIQGIWAAACAMSAIAQRAQSGRGQMVTVGGAHAAAIAGCATSIVDPTQNVVAPPAGPGGPNATYTRYECADGRWLFLGALTPKFQLATFALLEITDIVQDPRLGGDLDAMLLVSNRAWVRERVTARFAAESRDHWLTLLMQADVPAGPIESREDWLDHPQVEAIGMRVHLDDPRRGPVTMPGIPLNLTGSPGAVNGPIQTVEMPDWQSTPKLAAKAPAPGGPLSGFRVLDLGTVLAGPLAGSLLAELGADVVKVEPLTGDPFRTKGFMYNRGMRSIAINLRESAGRAAFYDLVRGADVVIDNFRPGVLDRLQIDYDRLKDINSRIITLSFTGYGEGGPLSAMPGFDPVLQGLSGMMRAQGGDGEPVFLTMAVNDITSAALGAFGVAVALHHRERTGDGQRIWGSLAGTSAFMQSGELTRFAGRPPARTGGNDFNGPAPLDQLYQTADGWIRVQAATASQQEILTQSKFGQDPAAVFMGMQRDEVLAELQTLTIPAAAARQVAELVDDEQLRRLDIIQEQSRPSGIAYYAPGRLASFSTTGRSDAMSPPGLGEHSVELLREAGLEQSQIDELISSGIIVTGDPMALDNFLSYR